MACGEALREESECDLASECTECCMFPDKKTAMLQTSHAAQVLIVLSNIRHCPKVKTKTAKGRGLHDKVCGMELLT